MPAATTSTGSALPSGQPELTKWSTVSVAPTSAPVTKTAFRAMRARREPARRRALPMRLDIGKSSRSLEIRSSDSAAPFRRLESQNGDVAGLVSPEEAPVLGIFARHTRQRSPSNKAHPAPGEILLSLGNSRPRPISHHQRAIIGSFSSSGLRNGCAQSGSAALDCLSFPFTSLHARPCLGLLDEPAQLFQQDAGGCALALERLDPVEPGQHCAGLVHADDGSRANRTVCAENVPSSTLAQATAEEPVRAARRAK